MPSYYTENNVPAQMDTPERSLQKINSILNDAVPVTASSSSVTPATANTSQVVFPANANRKFLLVQNLSDSVMYLGIGINPNPAVPEGIYLAPNGGGFVAESSVVPNSEIRIACSGVSKRFHAIQG
jgi:hypothetical protein